MWFRVSASVGGGFPGSQKIPGAGFGLRLARTETWGPGLGPGWHGPPSQQMRIGQIHDTQRSHTLCRAALVIVRGPAFAVHTRHWQPPRLLNQENLIPRFLCATSPQEHAWLSRHTPATECPEAGVWVSTAAAGSADNLHFTSITSKNKSVLQPEGSRYVGTRQCACTPQHVII